jgi:hypothetical protein
MDPTVDGAPCHFLILFLIYRVEVRQDLVFSSQLNEGGRAVASVVV